MPPFFRDYLSQTITATVNSDQLAVTAIGSFTIEFRLECPAFGSTQVRFFNENIYEGWTPNAVSGN